MGVRWSGRHGSTPGACQAGRRGHNASGRREWAPGAGQPACASAQHAARGAQQGRGGASRQAVQAAHLAVQRLRDLDHAVPRQVEPRGAWEELAHLREGCTGREGGARGASSASEAWAGEGVGWGGAALRRRRTLATHAHARAPGGRSRPQSPRWFWACTGRRASARTASGCPACARLGWVGGNELSMRLGSGTAAAAAPPLGHPCYYTPSPSRSPPPPLPLHTRAPLLVVVDGRGERQVSEAGEVGVGGVEQVVQAVGARAGQVAGLGGVLLRRRWMGQREACWRVEGVVVGWDWVPGVGAGSPRNRPSL